MKLVIKNTLRNQFKCITELCITQIEYIHTIMTIITK